MVRTYSKVVLAVLLCGGLNACSGSDSSGGGGGDKYGNRQIDTSNFKNSASEGEFKKKGDGVDEYFSDLSEVKNTFMASGAGNSIAVAFKAMMADEGDVSVEPAPEECQTDYTLEETPAGDYLNVETTTCVSDADGKKTTCVEVVKKNWNDEIVSTGKSCESSQSTTTTTTTTTASTSIGSGASGQYLPSFNDIKDCEDAFGTFEQTYQGVKTEFDNVYGMLMSPDGLSLAGSGLTDAGELEKVENDDKSAITYKITAPAQGGFKASGTISGGANETTLLLRQKLKVSFDLADMMSQSGSTNDTSINPPMGSDQPEQPTMPSMQMAIDTDGTIAVDTTRKLIEQDIDMTMVIGMDDQSSASTAKGRISVSAGDEKFVTVKMDVGAAAADQKMAANINMETRLVDENTLTFRATMNGDQAGEMSFDLVRNAEGKCEVKNEKNTMPKSEQASGESKK